MTTYPTMTIDTRAGTFTVHMPGARSETFTSLAAAMEALRVAMRDALDGRKRVRRAA